MEEEHGGLWGLSSHSRMGSSSTTPYESAVCSPRSSTDKAPSGYYSVTAPTGPLTIKCGIRSSPATGMSVVIPSSNVCSNREELLSDDFDFSSRFSERDPPWSPTLMSSADELFYNGRIRPLWYNCEDLAQVSSDYGSKGKKDDDDSHFDFRSSADYKFSTSSTVHSATIATSKAQRHAGNGYNGYSCDECSVHSHRQVNEDGKEDAGEMDSTRKVVQRWRASSKQGHDEMIAKQILMVKVEESRGRHAGCYKEGGIRRSRSLSPLRVFHMDDELPRPSVGMGTDDQAAEQGTQMVRIKGRRLTLKELLHSSSRTEHMSNEKQGEKMQSKPCMDVDVEKNTKEGSVRCFKCSARRASDSKLKGSNYACPHVLGHQASMSPHGLRYVSHTDQTRQQTFLPYKQGLLGCLGITSRSYRSVAGMRTFHSKSQVTSRSAGYDNSSK